MDRQVVAKYLTYWVAFALSEVASPVMSVVLPGHFWVFTRLLLVVWLLNPNFEGALKLYGGVVQPLLDKYEPSVQQAVQQARLIAL